MVWGMGGDGTEGGVYCIEFEDRDLSRGGK